jgi:subtilisin family serine protease
MCFNLNHDGSCNGVTRQRLIHFLFVMVVLCAGFSDRADGIEIVVRTKGTNDSIESVRTQFEASHAHEFGKLKRLKILNVREDAAARFLDALRSLPFVDYAGYATNSGQARYLPNDAFLLYDANRRIVYDRDAKYERDLYAWGTTNTGQNSLTYSNGVLVSQYTELGTTGADVRTAALWSVTTNAGDIVVAIIDTGINSGHYEFTNSPNISVNSIGRFNGTWSANITDTAGHGTAVASIIGANGNNGFGGAGLCFGGVNILVLATTPWFLEGDVLALIDYGLGQGARIFNCSFGGSYSIALQFALSEAAEYGAFFICAAPNSPVNVDTDTRPIACKVLAEVPNVIAVSSLTITGDRYSWSAFGTNNDMLAPGRLVIAPKPSPSLDGFHYTSGTSFATPHVSSALAYIMAYFPEEPMVKTKARLQSAVRAGVVNQSDSRGGAVLDMPSTLTSTPSCSGLSPVIPDPYDTMRELHFAFDGVANCWYGVFPTPGALEGCYVEVCYSWDYSTWYTWYTFWAAGDSSDDVHYVNAPWETPQTMQGENEPVVCATIWRVWR